MKINSFVRTFPLKCLAVLTIIISLTISGCAPILNSVFNNSLPPLEGEQIVPGLSQKVTVKRDNMGIPYIEATNMEDMIFAMGYVSAYDRFTQMEGFRLVGKGRLSELLGKATLEMDIYVRSLNLNQTAQTLYLSATPELRHMLKVYSDGVNAYLANASVPMMLTIAGHKPEPWKPLDSVYVFLVLTLGLGANLHEEINMLNIAQVIEPEKMAWLFPIYPDEPLPFEEMKKLKELNLKTAAADIEHLGKIAGLAHRLLIQETVASNNWAVSGKLTKSGKPILANDTHLPLSMPSVWQMMHLKCPEIEGAGIAIAGVPGIIAGYNKYTAVGMTMVMADDQDIFLEKLKQEPDGLYYLYQDKWLKAKSRQETFHIKGQKDVIRTYYETRHGVLLNNILTDEPRHLIVPMPANPSLGIALSWDDIITPAKEERHQILARTVLDAIDLLETKCGKDSEKWQWGKLHTYHWKTDATLFSDYMGFVDKTGVKFLSGYFDRGPYPAPGDHTTLNVAAYHPGKDFDVWLIPAMRVIVDFGSEEPLVGINSTGQSDNPSSPFYDDGIKAFLEGKYQNFPFKEENVKKHYTRTLTLVPKQ